MKGLQKISKLVSKQDIKLFLCFYIASTLVYYTATWISYGAFNPGHASYFDIEEFFSAAGVQFIVSFLISIPIWYVIFVRLRNYRLIFLLRTHIFFLPVYIVSSYFALLLVKKIFGWAMIWGGYSTVWTVYIFMLFYMLQFGLIHAYVYFKRYKNEEKEKAILLDLTLKSELVALKSQLNPHFLHNLFNSINATIPAENELTRGLIVQLSDLFRYQNYASQHEFVTIQEEIDFIEDYLQLMKVRFKERLTYTFDVSSKVKGLSIAPMLLQPLVENAVSHGVAPKISPSNILIKISKTEGKIHVEIIDTGVGLMDKDAALSKGLGLSNTKLRLSKIYNAELKIENVIPSGTKISFAI